MFVAVWPDGATLERLSLLVLEPAPGLRLVRAEQWHVTLRFLGEVDEDRAPVLVDALRGAAGELAAPVRCALGPATAWFDGARVLQIPVAGLDPVAHAVRSWTRAVVPVSSRGEGRFSGHLTLARANPRRLGVARQATLAGVPFTATFDVDSFDLITSRASPEGHRYATLARVAFRGGPEVAHRPGGGE
ncbi:MAG: RNA 2',3'-cyclic phosphodiesterase [Acidimicrobiales bacterium]